MDASLTGNCIVKNQLQQSITKGKVVNCLVLERQAGQYRDNCQWSFKIFCFHELRNMPDIESLMQEWPPEFEDLLNQVNLKFNRIYWIHWLGVLKIFVIYVMLSEIQHFLVIHTILLRLSFCQQVGLPTADLDVELHQYVDLICGKLLNFVSQCLM